jgi:hypothetical protein
VWCARAGPRTGLGNEKGNGSADRWAGPVKSFSKFQNLSNL